MEEAHRAGSRAKPNVFDCPEAFAKWYCLNGATCFMVKARSASLYNCWCKEGFHGLRCDYKYIARRPEALDAMGNTDERRSHFTFIRSPARTTSENLIQPHEAMMTKQVKEQVFEPAMEYATLGSLLLLLSLIILLLLLMVRRRKQSLARRPHKLTTAAHRADLVVALNNGLINQDRVEAEFALIESLNHLRRQAPAAAAAAAER